MRGQLFGIKDKTIFENKIMLVTGLKGEKAERALEIFTAAGCKVIAAVADQDSNMEALAEKIRRNGKNIRIYVCDLICEKSVADMFEEINLEIGTVDYIVNFHDCYEDVSLELTDEKKYSDMSDMVRGTFNCCKTGALYMKRKKRGRIINVSAIQAKNGGYKVKGGVHYCTAMAAIAGMTKGLALELAPHGITANAILPTVVAENIQELEFSGKTIKKIPGIDDVCMGALFLLSPSSAYTTGYCLDINGGLMMD